MGAVPSFYDDFLDSSTWAKPEDAEKKWSSPGVAQVPEPGEGIMEAAGNRILDVASGTLDTAAIPFSVSQNVAGRFGDEQGADRSGLIAGWLHSGAEAVRGYRSEAGKRAAEAKFFPAPGEGSVLDHPVSSATSKLGELVPFIASLGLFPEGAIGALAGGATMQVGQVVDEAMRGTQGKSDAELQTEFPAYKRYRDGGMEEAAAKQRLMSEMVTVGDVAGAVAVGSLGMAPAIKILRSGVAADGLVKRAATGAAEAGLGMGSAAIDSDISGQRAEMAGGKRESYDLDRTLLAGAEGLAGGAVLGAATGALHKSKVAVVDEASPDAAQRAALDAHANEGAQGAAPQPAVQPEAPAAPAPQAPQPTAPEAAAPVPQPVAEAARRVQAREPQAPVTPEGNAEVSAPTPTPVPQPVADAARRVSRPADDTGQNVPESPPTLEAQRQKLVDGEVPAVMYPKGTKPLPTPPGMKRINLPRGIFDYDPARTSADAIRKASLEGRENEILGLGPMSKDDVVAAAQETGETPVAVVERAPDGTEVKGTLATPSTVDVQAPTIEANKTPGNTVAVEPAGKAVAERAAAASAETVQTPAQAETPAAKVEAVKQRAAGPRILPDLSETGRAAADEARDLGAHEADRIKRENRAAAQREQRLEDGPVALEKKSAAEKAKRVSDARAAEAIFRENTTSDITVPRNDAELAALHERLKRISEAADAAGVTVPAKVGYESTADHIVWLREVRDLLAKMDREKAGRDHILDFLLREAAARSGDFSVMRSERKAAGDAAARGAQKDVATVAAAPEYRETALTGDAAPHAEFRDRGPENTAVGGRERGPVRLDDGTEKAEVKGADGKVATVDRAKGGEVRKVELTPELKAKYEALAGKVKPAEAKTGAEKVVAVKERAVKERTKEQPHSETAKRPATTVDEWGSRGRRSDVSYETGRKVVADVFHGTMQSFDKFKRDRLGSSTGAPSAAEAFFFARSPETANFYAGAPDPLTRVGNHEIVERAKVRARDKAARGSDAVEDRYSRLTPEQQARYDALEALVDKVHDPEAVARKIQDLLKASDELRALRELADGRTAAGDAKEGSRVIMARIKLDNPLVHDFKGERVRTEAYTDLIRRAKDEGHDGVVMLNTFDNGPKDTIYAVFNEAGIEDRHGGRLANRVYDPRADLELAHGEFDRGNIARENRTIFGESGAAVEPLHTIRAREALDSVRPEAMKGAGSLMPFVRKRLREVVGDIDVHIVDREQMAELEGTWGSPTSGYYDTADHHIVLRADLPREMQEHTILHEAVHAATAQAITTDKHLRGLVERIMAEVEAGHGFDTVREVPYSDVASPLAGHYGMENAHEFLAEAMSNTAFQKKLSGIRISPELARDLGLPQWRKQSIWSGFIAFVRHALRLPQDAHTALEGITATMERIVDRGPPDGPGGAPLRLRNVERDTGRELGRLFKASHSDALARGVDGVRQSFATLVGNPVEHLTGSLRDAARDPAAGDTMRRIGRHLATNDQYRQNIEHLFPGEREENLARRVFDTVEKQGVRSQELRERGDDVVRAMARAQKAVPEAFRRFADLLNDATMVGVDPSAPIGAGRNRHLALSKEAAKKDAKGTLEPHELPMAQWEALAAHPKLVERYRELTSRHPEFAPLMDETFRFFHDAQQDMARGHIENILRGLGAEGDLSLRAAEIRDARASEEWQEKIEKEFGEPALDEILKAKQLSGSEGPYAPLMRHGDWVVVGRYAVKEPANAIARNGDTWEFRTRKEARDFAEATGLHYSVRTSYYDPQSGKKTTKGDISVHGDPEQRFAVTLQRDHVEFHESRAKADEARGQLAASGLLEHMSEALDRRQHEGLASELTSAGMQTILKRLEQTGRYKAASASERAEMRKALAEASLAMRSGNRVQSRRLPRRRVAGASDDVIRNVHEYNISQANYRAKQEFRPQVDDAITEMREYERAHQFDKGATERSVAANEIERRARAADPAEYSGAWTDFTRRIGTLSYIDRMLRPSHLILHQTHLPMITAPIIAGRHGVARTYGMMTKAWGLATRAYGAGGRDFVASIADNLHKGIDYTRLMKESFAKETDAARLGRMFDTLGEIGLIHPQGSLDGAEVIRNSASRDRSAPMRIFDGVLGKLDTTFRHLTNATEAINRYVGATMAYRLEFERLTREGKVEAEAHDLAVDYARHILANTQGWYSSTNSAPLFKNKWLKPFLQFRQFPQMMYHLLGRTVVRAFTGATREEKVQAVKSLGLILLSHSAMTGALGGLPLEAPMIVTTVAKGLGITDSDWKDVEHAEYAWAVRTFGKDAARVIMHGLGAEVGLDVHHRMGLNSFFTFGMPDRMDAKSVWGFLGQQAMGAPGGLAADAFTGISRMANGDLAAGAAKAFPLQALRDVRTAWEGGSKAYKYTPAERAVRLMGFTPSGEAEHYNAQREVTHARDAYEDKRRKLMRSWVEADASDKGKAWIAIQKFNAGKAKDSQITMSQLRSMAERDTSDDVAGVRLGRRTKFIADDYRALH